MNIRQLKKDFKRNRLITVVLILFVVLSSMMAASALSVIAELTGSLDNLFNKANVPHIVQKHVGEYDQDAIDRFTAESSMISRQQTTTLVNIDSSNVYLGKGGDSENGSVMDNGFTTQSNSMDYLLNLENEKVQVSDGEIAVPVYHMQKRGLELGDKVVVTDGSFNMEFTITEFMRDAVNNPSVLNAKRFVISEKDFSELYKSMGNIDNIEYMIEFQLHDIKDLASFTNDYQSANLPQAGPAASYSLLKVMNALSDGLIAAVIILVSILLVIVAMLCLRFTILTTMEEDYREIGVMKAIGIAGKNVKQIYLLKYLVIGGSGSLIGYVLSLFVSKSLCANILLYMGVADKSVLHYIAPLLAAGCIFLITVGFCYVVLRKLNKISALEALRPGTMTAKKTRKSKFSLIKTKLPVNQFLGLKDIAVRFKMYILLIFTFFICTFIIFVPMNFLNTTNSPEFVTYMGIGETDIRIDLQHIADMNQRFSEIQAALKKDHEIEKHAGFVTSRFQVYDGEGMSQSINIESGNFSVFPLKYLTGTAPVKQDEIALSALNAQDLVVEKGDTLRLVDAEGKEQKMRICGIYQDLTNGGRTAKSMIPYNPQTVLWYVVNFNVKPDVDIAEKTKEYEAEFAYAQVSDTEEYRLQTFSTTISQLRIVTIFSIAIAVMILILITALFLRMLLAKDNSQITIMRSLGFTQKDIRQQYIVRSLAVLCAGIVLGTMFSNTAGQALVGGILSSMGASKIEFIINPAVSYILCPALLIAIVTVTTMISTRSIKATSIAELNAE